MVGWSCDYLLFWPLPESATELSQHLHHDGISRQAHDFRCGDSFFFGRWWGSTVHLIHLNTDSRRWEWIEYRGPLSLITNFAWIVDASFQTKFFHYNNLTVLPCSLDGFPPPPTRCGTLDGIHNRWDFKGNFVEVIWWTSSHKLSLKLRLRRNLLILGSKIPSWINNWRHKLSLISSTFNNSFLSINPLRILTQLPLHLLHNQHLKHQNHQHLWHLHPHKLAPVHPSTLKRWCSRWRTRSNPVSNAAWTNFRHLHMHQFQSLHRLPATSIHLMMFQHHINDPTDDPGPNVIDLDPEDLTNVRSPSLAVLAVTDLQDEPVVRLDHDPRPEEDSPRRDVPPDDQAGLRRSLFGQPPHDIEKYDAEIKMTTHHRNQLTHQPLSNLQRGNTTHKCHITTPTLNHTTTTTTNTPPTSGNPEDNGKTIQNPQIHPMLQVGLTTQNHQPVITLNTTPPPNHSRHSPLTPTQHTFNKTDHHTGQVQSNPVAQPLSLQDMLPSTFKMVPRTSGFATSDLPWVILKGCELPMKFRLPNDPSRQQRWTTKIMNRPVNSSIRSTNASLRMASKKLSNYFSVPTFCLATTYPPATSENFQSPTLLPSSCPYLTPVISRCRLPLANVKTTHGHSFMGRHFILLSRSSSKARSDQPTGHIIEIFNVANCQPLGHSTLAGKYPTVTRPSHHGRRESFSMLSKRKEKDSKTSSSGRCTEDQPTTPHTKLEAMSWLSSVWWKKELSPRLRSTRLPTATMWDWNSLLSSGKTWIWRSTLATHPQKTITTAAMRNATQVVVDGRTSALSSCYHVLLALFGLNRNPNLTFLGTTWTRFWSKSMVAPIWSSHYFRNSGGVHFIALRCNCILLEDFLDFWVFFCVFVTGPNFGSLTSTEPSCIALQFCFCPTA